jgi:hydroxymethylpyrimidine/phosphomethylpyrimidine kinase
MEGTGRVGLLADVAAVEAEGGVASCVVTALTAQGSRFTLSPVPAAMLSAQLSAALAEARPRAVKVGAVPDRESLGLLFPTLVRLGVPVVVDPVVRTSGGERLSRLLPADFRRLGHRRVWLTPNLRELAWLTGRRALPSSLDDVTALALALLADGFGAVVVKGGHLLGPPVDVLVTAARVVRFGGTRLKRGSWQRGTGCRFASTLATRLALGYQDATAVGGARSATRRYLSG